MKLADYLAERQETQQDFGKRLSAQCGGEIAQPMVSRWCTGRVRPRRIYRQAILVATGGAVTEGDWPDSQACTVSLAEVAVAAANVGVAAGDLQRSALEAMADRKIDEAEAADLNRKLDALDLAEGRFQAAVTRGR